MVPPLLYNTTCGSTGAYRRGKNGRCQALGLPWQYPVSLMMHWRKGGYGGVCTYHVQGTAVVRLPTPDERQAAILRALGTPLPTERSLRKM